MAHCIDTDTINFCMTNNIDDDDDDDDDYDDDDDDGFESTIFQPV